MDNQQLIVQLKRVQRDLEKRRDDLRKPLEDAQQALDHIEGAIAYLETGIYPQTIEEALERAPTYPPAKLKGLTQLQAIVTIAKHNGGTVKAQDARHLMIRAGVMRDTKNSTNITHNTIIRSGRFERIRPGEYRLKESQPKPERGDLFRQPIQ